MAAKQLRMIEELVKFPKKIAKAAYQVSKHCLKKAAPNRGENYRWASRYRRAERSWIGVKHG